MPFSVTKNFTAKSKLYTTYPIATDVFAGRFTRLSCEQSGRVDRADFSQFFLQMCNLSHLNFFFIKMHYNICISICKEVEFELSKKWYKLEYKSWEKF